MKITVEDVSKRFGRQLLFRGVSFEIEKGEMLGITGPNGAGKSSLVQILAGLLRQTKGTVRYFDEKEIPREAHPYHVGLVAPYLQLYGLYTPRENLAFLARARGMGNVQSRIDTILDDVALLPHADKPLKTFSSGMLQRARFAAALLDHPPVLLLDEPSSNLDEAGIERMQQLAERDRQKGTIIIVATNDKRDLSRVDRTIHIPNFL